jgi:hypothetical protein
MLPKYGVEQSPLSGAEAIKGGAIPPLPPYVFIAYCLINDEQR